MSHVRQQIAEAITTALTGLPTTADRAVRSSVYPTQASELPCLRIRYSKPTEGSAPQTLPAPRVFQRHCRLEVAAYAVNNDDVESDLNAICVEVEKALAMPAASGPWKTLTLIATNIESSGDGTQPFGEAVMTYEAVYHARETTPDTTA